MTNFHENDQNQNETEKVQSNESKQQDEFKSHEMKSDRKMEDGNIEFSSNQQNDSTGFGEGRPVERSKGARSGARGTAAMDPKTRQEVARKGGLAVSRNRQHMAEIGRKGGLSVSKNRDHMAAIGRKGGAASRGHR